MRTDIYNINTETVTAEHGIDRKFVSRICI